MTPVEVYGWICQMLHFLLICAVLGFSHISIEICDVKKMWFFLFRHWIQRKYIAQLVKSLHIQAVQCPRRHHLCGCNSLSCVGWLAGISMGPRPVTRQRRIWNFTTPWRIHGTSPVYLPIHDWLFFNGINVGKYTKLVPWIRHGNIPNPSWKNGDGAPWIRGKKRPLDIRMPEAAWVTSS